MAKISGPLLDRIDLHIEVPAVKYKELGSNEAGESYASIRQRVISAREIQMKRFEGRKGMYCNADMQSKDIQSFCKLDAAGEELLTIAITKLGLSPRAYDRIQSEGHLREKLHERLPTSPLPPSIRPEHISEAIQYRCLDRSLWQD